MAMKKAAGKSGKAKSRFAGVQAAGDRIPQLGPGEYLLEVTETGVSRDSSEYYKAYAKVIEVLDDQSDKGDPGEGDDCTCLLQCLAGKAARPGFGKIKSFAIALAGHDSEAEYDEFDPDGLYAEHVLNDGHDGTDENGDDYPPIAGTRVKVRVRRGKPTADGSDYYRENVFSPAETAEA